MSAARAVGMVMHASCVAWNGHGLLIMGPSGSGKSGLALELMALGCDLVSDDRTALAARDGVVLATAPESLRGKIEARGVGILAADVARMARLALCVDLARVEPDRLPHEHLHNVLGVDLPCLHGVESRHFPAAVLQYLKGGRVA
ncbi:HPr kinase/phosphorylase [Albidovulum sp.]|uniref:HPr kinase/phosphorylase n=1 Tax=Albidovulum sp. TaxID=1872424 RepID=UPI003529976D